MSSEDSKAIRSTMRELREKLAPLGFTPTRSTFFARRSGDFIEFFHLYKFNGALEFRVHCGTRALDDTTPHAVLNGPSSDSVVTRFKNPLVPHRLYRFNFDASPKSIRRCAETIFDFCRKTGETWFREWREQHPTVGRQLSSQTADVFRLHDDVAVKPCAMEPTASRRYD